MLSVLSHITVEFSPILTVVRTFSFYLFLSLSVCFFVLVFFSHSVPPFLSVLLFQ